MRAPKHAAPELLQRPNRAVAVALVGLSTVLIGGFAVYMAIERIRVGEYPLGTGPDGWLGGLTWDTTVGWAISIGLICLGIALLVAAWKPGRHNALVVNHERVPAAGRTAAGSRELVIGNEDLERWLRRVAENLDGVSRATVRASARRINVVITTSVSDPEVVRGAIESHLRQRVDGLELEPNPSLRIRIG